MFKRTLTMGLVASGLAMAAARGADRTVDITVDAAQVVGHVDEKIYGHFLEHIYHSASAGVWGQVVWNGSFEEFVPRPAATQSQKPKPVIVAPVSPLPAGSQRTKARHWLARGPGEVTLDTENPLNDKQSLHIVAETAAQSVLQQHIGVRAGDALRGSLWARGTAAGGITVRLVDGTTVLATATLPAPDAAWKEFPIVLAATANARDAVLEITGRGNFWLDQVSLMADSSRATGGFRPDILKAVADLHPAIIRWPGGSFMAGYHWKNGIGPQARRLGKKGWDEYEPLAFGLDEFMAFCGKVGAQPLVVVHIGPQTQTAPLPDYIQEACDCVEYCNGPATSKWGAARAANGHPEPYNVKYWELDNEVWHMVPDVYAQVVRAFAPAMKKIDPTIHLSAAGSGQLGNRWSAGDAAIINQAAECVDYLSIHHYENPDNFAVGPERDVAFWHQLGMQIAASKNPHLKLFVSEWNAQSTDWRTGLYAGGILNAFERAPEIAMATPALWLRHISAPAWDNALINFDHAGWFPAPNYVVMKLYRDHYAPDVLAIAGATGGVNVNATRSADAARLVCKLVNPDETPVTVHVALKGGFAIGGATLQVVAPGSLTARNTMENPDAVKPQDQPVKTAAAGAAFTLPPLAVAVLELHR